MAALYPRKDRGLSSPSKSYAVTWLLELVVLCFVLGFFAPRAKQYEFQDLSCRDVKDSPYWPSSLEWRVRRRCHPAQVTQGFHVRTEIRGTSLIHVHSFPCLLVQQVALSPKHASRQELRVFPLAQWFTDVNDHPITRDSGVKCRLLEPLGLGFRWRGRA